jgi:sulfane dehydrogenase subunit SoxC
MGQRRTDEDTPCACQDGLFPARRRFLFGAGAATALAHSTFAAPPDPTKVQGRPTGTDGGYGSRSAFETAHRVLGPVPNSQTTWTFTPLAEQIGNLTASGLHYERHHAGIPAIDPQRHSLIVHGLVSQAKRFTMADLKRLPRVSRRHFIECSGNTGGAYQGLPLKSVQVSHGLLSTSEWTGVSFAVLAREVGISPDAAWVLAEGADAAVMTRSIPLDKMMRDAILAYGQNGEAIRPEQGYPLRLLLPGYEGNTHIKWLRRLQVSDKPFMTREETSKYTDLMANGVAQQFVFTMDAKSVITFPSPEMRLPGPGFYEIGGLAWSGRGRVRAVQVSVDGGAHWQEAALSETPEPMCSVRFTLPWRWDGNPVQLASRCIDETGYVQPSHQDLLHARGANFYYHYNAIYPWSIAADGSVTHAAA